MSTATAERQEPQGQDESPLKGLLGRDSSYMRPELAQMRMENETIMAECKMHPRDFESIKRDLLAQLKAFPDLATEAIYEKPVGKDQNTGEQKYVRGLSIRAAETLAESYGYNRIRSSVDDIGDGEKVKIEATFTDFQKGRIWQDAGILGKTYKDRYGKVQRINDDRFYNVVVKAEVSKRVREVITRSVNAGLKAWFEAECEKISCGLLDDKTITKIVDQYATKNVTVEMLESLVGRARSMGWTQTDRQRLLSIWNAIKDGETTVAEVFADKPATALPPEPKKDKPSMPPADSTRPQTTPDVDTERLDFASMVIRAAKDTQAVDFELDGLLANGGLNEPTIAAIKGLAIDRKKALAEAEQKAAPKRQKELAK